MVYLETVFLGSFEYESKDRKVKYLSQYEMVNEILCFDCLLQQGNDEVPRL